jgi:hypothetical protein
VYGLLTGGDSWAFIFAQHQQHVPSLEEALETLEAVAVAVVLATDVAVEGGGVNQVPMHANVRTYTYIYGI